MASLIAIGVNNPKQIKKWKFSTSDQAGTRPTGSVESTLIGMATARGPVAPGSGLEFARATNRPIAYYTQDGMWFDEEMNRIEKKPRNAVPILISEEELRA